MRVIDADYCDIYLQKGSIYDTTDLKDMLAEFPTVAPELLEPIAPKQ